MIRVRYNEDLPSEDLTGRRVHWVQPVIHKANSGTVLADWRGKTVEDIISREKTKSINLLVQDDRGVRHSVPDYWIEQVDA